MLGKFNYYLILIVGFSLSLLVANLHNIGIIILVASWGLTLFVPRLQFKWLKLFSPLASLFVIILAGILYSDNKNYGLFFIESFTILMILPVVLLGGENRLSRIKLLKVITAFIAGVLTLNLISLFFISYDLWDPKNLQSNLIIANNVIVKIHPAFLSMYISLCVFFLADQYFPLSKLNRTKLGWVGFSLVVLIVFLIWLNSRAGILAFFVAALFFVGFKWKGKTRTLGYVGLISFLVLIVAIPFSYHRFVETPLMVLRGDTKGAMDDPSVYPLVTRLQIYKSDLELLKWPEIIYGYGTGDFRDVLQERFRANNYERPLAENMDSHSEYFAQLHRHGIIGLGLFLALLIIPFRHAIKYRSPLLGSFIILFAITALFENVFSAQKGVTFFALFCPLLWLFAKLEYEAKTAS